jgi:hypothetical protein
MFFYIETPEERRIKADPKRAKQIGDAVFFGLGTTLVIMLGTLFIQALR